MKGLKLRGVVGLFGLVMCGASLLVAHVYKQNSFVRFSINGAKLARQKTQLRNDIALLEVEVGGLKKLSRIESVAKARFGLEYGNAPVLVYPDGNSREARRLASAPQVAPDQNALETGKIAWLTKGL